MKHTHRFGILLYLFLLPASLVAQDTASVSFEPFTTFNGLTSNIVTDIVQDDDGFLWIATADGLNRFDGTEVKQFLHDSTGNSIPSNYVYCLKLLPGHTLAIGTTAGTSFYNLRTRTFTNYYFRDSSGLDYYDNSIIAITTDQSGNIWIGSQSCIFKLSPQRKLLKTIRSGYTKADIGKERLGYTQKLAHLQGDSMLLMTVKGNYIYEPLRDTVFRISDQATGKYGFLSKMRSWEFFPVSDRRFIFFKTNVDSLYLYNYRTEEVLAAYYPFNIQPYHLFMRQVCQLDANRFFINDQLNGFSMVYINGNNITAPPVLRNNNLPFGKAMQDRQGNWWVINQLGGLLKKNAVQKKIRYTPVNSLSDKYSIASIKQIDNELWLSVYGGGIIILDSLGKEKHFKFTGTPNDIWPNYVWQCRQYNRDTIWVGTGNGLFWLHKKNFHFGRLPDYSGRPAVLDSFAITTQYVDSKGRVWMGIGGGRGLCIFYPQTKTFRHLKGKDPNGYIFRYPAMIKEDASHRLWFTSDNINRLLYWDEEKQHMVPVSLPATKEPLSHFNALHIDRDNIFWIGTHNSGLVRYDPAKQTVKIYGRDEGICNSFIDDIVEDEFNHLWITTRGGLSSFDKKKETFVNYYQKDGLNNGYLECNFYKDAKSGLLYSGGYGGLIRFNPEALRTDETENVKLLFTGVQINGQEYREELSNRLVLQSNEKNISVSFSTVDLMNGPWSKYYYRLFGGSDTAWTSLGTQRQLNFSNLAPGAYTLQVRSADEGGNWNSSFTTLNFAIRPPFTQTIWFYSLLLLAGVGIFYIIYRYRINRFLEMEKVRGNISRDLHDEIGANLTNISYLSLLAQKNVKEHDQVSGLLTRIYDDSRTVSESMREIVWSINPENDNLEKALPRMLHYASEMLETKGIHVKASLPDNIEKIHLTMEQRRDLYLIFKEAVNNLAKHAEARNAHISFSYRTGIISMRIEDDGKGFGTTTYLTNGLKNMNERARKHKWGINITSIPSKGTRVEVEAQIV